MEKENRNLGTDIRENTDTLYINKCVCKAKNYTRCFSYVFNYGDFNKTHYMALQDDRKVIMDYHVWTLT